MQEAEGEEIWKKVSPKTADAHKKMVNGKEYHFCVYHNAWTVHKDKDCCLKKGQEGASMTKTRVNSPYQANSPASSNANTIQSFQVILTKLLLE